MLHTGIKNSVRLPMFILLLPFLSYSVLAVESTIEVRGQSSLMVEPDQFSVQVQLREQGRNSEKLKLVVDKKSTIVVDIAKKLGIKNKDIISARINFRPIKDEPSIKVQGGSLKHSSAKNNEGKIYYYVDETKNSIQKNQKFELTRFITIKFVDIRDYDKFLAEIFKVKVSYISPLNMSIRNSDDYYQQALLEAVTQATQKAQSLAKKAGIRLGKITSITETSSNNLCGLPPVNNKKHL